MRIQVLTSASNLEKEWDDLCLVYFQRKKFLTYSEKYNPCNQKYYLLYNDDFLIAGACVYTLKINLLTFSNISMPVQMKVVGVPASVSCPGIIGEHSYCEVLLGKICSVENGLLLAMNIPTDLYHNIPVLMRTLPTIQIDNKYQTWKEYKQDLRSSYRRRINKLSESFNNIKTTHQNCSWFNQEHYDLYLQIWNKTKTKLEKLSIEYFINLPQEFKLTTYIIGEKMVTWHINLIDNDELIFFYGGTDYEMNKNVKVYFNNLLGILKEAISLGVSNIDLGQTAEVPKLRLGGNVIEKNMILYHNNFLIRLLIKLGKPALQYNRKIVKHHVFKNAIN